MVKLGLGGLYKFHLDIIALIIGILRLNHAKLIDEIIVEINYVKHSITVWRVFVHNGCVCVQ